MNSEELEQSLRSEFETYLNTVFADLRQETAEFQNKIQAEFDRHKSQFDEAFAAISARFDSTPGFNEAFNSSVAEHLKLARDEGAKIAANAMVEAEKFEEKPAPAARYDAIRDAVNDISSKDSQSSILKTLVQHAEEFAPRGAFFIIKSGHFAGWKVFGTADDMEQTVREVHFPVSQETILSEAVDSLSTVESQSGKHSEDSAFLDPLSFGKPSSMMALPLIARGRAVAVMYVDGGDADGEINRDALETIIRVAGLTVELLASTQTAAEENRSMAAADFEDTRHDQESVPSPQDSYESAYPSSSQESPVAPSQTGGYSFTESEPSEGYSTEPDEAAHDYGMPFHDIGTDTPEEAGRSFESTIPNLSVEQPPAQGFEQGTAGSAQSTSDFESERQEQARPSFDYSFESPEAPAEQPQSQVPDYPMPKTSGFQAPAPEYKQPEPQYGRQSQEFGQTAPDYGRPAPEYRPTTPDYGQTAPEFSQPAEARSLSPFDAGPSDAESLGSSPFDRAVEEYKPAGAASGAAYTAVPEPVVPAPSSVPQARLSDRPVDLPIEVPEEERRLHNDARRFARLLVSEIKLYNEKKVIEGKKSHDLYERLREAIDRSREMYDKRVQPPVASKFDYFHYELLNSLAEGNVERLGPGYPGAKV